MLPIRSFRCLVLAFFLLTFPAAAMADAPTDSLKASIDEVLTLLKDPAYQDPSKKAALREKLIGAIKSVFNAEELSRRALGQNWKNFTPEQQKRFTEAFTTLLQNTYLDKIESYTDEAVNYLGEQPIGEGKVEVKTTIVHQGKDIPLTYRMIDKGSWKVYDVVIEGVSMVQNYRQQFADVLMRESPDALIDKILKKS